MQSPGGSDVRASTKSNLVTMRNIPISVVAALVSFNLCVDVAIAANLQEINLLVVEHGTKEPISEAVVRCGDRVAVTDGAGTSRISIQSDRKNSDLHAASLSSLIVCDASHAQFLLGRSYLIHLSDEENEHELTIELKAKIDKRNSIELGA